MEREELEKRFLQQILSKITPAVKSLEIEDGELTQKRNQILQAMERDYQSFTEQKNIPRVL